MWRDCVMRFLAERKPSNPGVLTGDIHGDGSAVPRRLPDRPVCDEAGSADSDAFQLGGGGRQERRTAGVRGTSVEVTQIAIGRARVAIWDARSNGNGPRSLRKRDGKALDRLPRLGEEIPGVPLEVAAPA